MPLLATASHRRRTLLVSVGLLVLLVPLLVPLPPIARHDPTLNLLGDRAHVVIFAGLAWLLHLIGPLRGRPLGSAIAATAIGGASEYLQQFVGRSTMFSDFVLDLLGIGLALTWIQWRRGHGRAALAAGAFLLAVLAYTMRDAPTMFRAMVDAQHSFPVLADFETREQLALWRERSDEGRLRVDVGPPHGNVLRVSTSGREHWPAVNAGRLPADWSGYGELVLEARLQVPAPDSLRLGIRLDDYASSDDKLWASLGYTVTHEWRTLRFPLTALLTDRHERPVDLADIFSLLVFLIRPAGPAAFEIDNVRLESPVPAIDKPSAGG
jgi:VanZ family protein